MKKRLSAFFLALVLCLGLAVPAFAADEDAPPEAYPVLRTPENSGIIYQSQNVDIKLVGFMRSGSSNAHITYGTYEDYGSGARLVPRGVDIVITGVDSADEIALYAFSAADMAEGPFKDLPGGTYLFYRLFVQEAGKDISLAPLNTEAPMEFAYDDPMDGKTQVSGRITAADAGFQVNGDGDVVLGSERLYALLDEGDLLQIRIGTTFWMYQLSGDPFLVSDVFTDVTTGSWLSDPVAWAWASDITTGTSETRFSPGINCTQAQILTFLYRAAREEQVKSSAKDMELALQWAREKGMIDDSFDGSAPCTRATAVSYIWQALNKPAAGASASFTDVSADDSFAGAVSWAVEKGITNGANADGTMFRPDETCTRGQIAAFLYRAYNN